MQSSDALMTEQQLRDWLVGKEQQEVGSARLETSCPCHRCIRDLHPELKGHTVEVGYGGYIYIDKFREGDTSYYPEPWLVNLVHRIDWGRDVGTPVLGSTVLQILGQRDGAS